LFERSRKRARLDPGADLRAASRKRADILEIERAQALFDAPVEPVVGEEFAERRGRGGEAAGDADAGRRQAADHFAEGRVLSADLGQVRQAQIL